MESVAQMGYHTLQNSTSCLVYDNSFGPQVDITCRPFDFTLLFEDAIFSAMPAALMLLLVPLRLLAVWREPPKTRSYGLAIFKQVRLLLT